LLREKSRCINLKTAQKPRRLAIRYPSGKVPEFEIIYEAGGDWMGFPDCDIDDAATLADAWLIELLRDAIDWLAIDSDLDLDTSYYKNWADKMAAKNPD
jgi:hypothetical protein